MGELESLLAEAVGKAERLQAQLHKLGTPVAAHREAPRDAPHEDAPKENAPGNSPQARAAAVETLLMTLVGKEAYMQAQQQELGAPPAAHREAPPDAPHEDAPQEEDAPWSSPQARAAAVETLLMTLVGKEAYMQAQQQALGAPPAARREALHYVPQAVARGRAFALQRRRDHAAELRARAAMTNMEMFD